MHKKRLQTSLLYETTAADWHRSLIVSVTVDFDDKCHTIICSSSTLGNEETILQYFLVILKRIQENLEQIYLCTTSIYLAHSYPQPYTSVLFATKRLIYTPDELLLRGLRGI